MPILNGDPCPKCGTATQKRKDGIFCRKCEVYFEEKKLSPVPENFLTSIKDARWADRALFKRNIQRIRPFFILPKD